MEEGTSFQPSHRPPNLHQSSSEKKTNLRRNRLKKLRAGTDALYNRVSISDPHSIRWDAHVERLFAYGALPGLVPAHARRRFVLGLRVLLGCFRRRAAGSVI